MVRGATTYKRKRQTPLAWVNFKSPLVWDVFAISTYAMISILFLFDRRTSLGSSGARPEDGSRGRTFATKARPGIRPGCFSLCAARAGCARPAACFVDVASPCQKGYRVIVRASERRARRRATSSLADVVARPFGLPYARVIGLHASRDLPRERCTRGASTPLVRRSLSISGVVRRLSVDLHREKASRFQDVPSCPSFPYFF